MRTCTHAAVEATKGWQQMELIVFVGATRYVKDADKDIIKAVKANGRLVDSGSLVHSYPFCWRSDTPLLYKVREPVWKEKETGEHTGTQCQRGRDGQRGAKRERGRWGNMGG
jgi:hypothetical protein